MTLSTSQDQLRWLLLFIGCVGCSSGAGQLLMRSGRKPEHASLLFNASSFFTYTRWWLGLAICLCCGLMWAYLASRTPLRLAIPTFVAAQYLVAVAGSRFFLAESCSARELSAFLLILGGVALLVTS
jgi:hypothetical protein